MGKQSHWFCGNHCTINEEVFTFTAIAEPTVKTPKQTVNTPCKPMQEERCSECNSTGNTWIFRTRHGTATVCGLRDCRTELRARLSREDCRLRMIRAKLSRKARFQRTVKRVRCDFNPPGRH